MVMVYTTAVNINKRPYIGHDIQNGIVQGWLQVCCIAGLYLN